MTAFTLLDTPTAEAHSDREALESLREFAGGVAHDFNNLLSVILNYAIFVAEATADNDAVLADVEEIRSAAECAARLTNQLLLFVRSESSRPATLDLHAVAADVPNACADRVQTEQIQLSPSVDARAISNGEGRCGHGE